jgi:hypothetical protein
MYLIILLLGFNFFPPAAPSSGSATTPALSVVDTFPPIITEDFIRDFTALPIEKTWRDSGYYFQLELVDWFNRGVLTAGNGDILIRTTIRSSDSSSGAQFRGRAVFRINSEDWSSGDLPSPKSVENGTAVLAFPQDVLICPSGNDEIGLGQSEQYLPLSLGGEIKKLGLFNDTILFSIPCNAQLRDFEVTME